MPRFTINQMLHLYMTKTSPPSRAQSKINQQAFHAFSTFLTVHTQLTLHTPLIHITIPLLLDFLTYLQENYAIETEHLYSRALLQCIQLQASTYEPLIPIADQFAQHLHQHRRKKQRSNHALRPDIIRHIRSHIQHIPTQHDNDRDRLRALRDRALLLTLIETGLRPTEVTNLRHHQYDPASHKLTTSQLNELRLSLSTAREISTYLAARAELDTKQALPPSQLPLFARHDRRAGPRVLPLSRWTIANIIDAHFPDTLPDSSPHLTPRTLRQYFIASVYQDTQDIIATQQKARHKTIATTRLYLPSQPNGQNLKP